MKFKTSFLVTTLVLNSIAVSLCLSHPSENFKLLPQPQKIEWHNGKGLKHDELKGIYLEGTTRPIMRGPLQDLPRIGYTTTGSLSLLIDKSLTLPSTEGYTLSLKDGTVTIKALSDAGLFYGVQTLAQLLEDAIDQQIEIPPCEITDYPEIAYRAVHLDLKHHIDAGHYYYDMIDRLAGIKVNAIIIEFEDKLRYRKAPLVAAPQSVSIEEFAAISKYAKERNIEISPLIQGLGHASFILKHPEYIKLRDDPSSDWVFDPMNPETYDLQFALYEDAIAATPNGRYLHVGGDEVGALGKSELSKASGKNPLELQLYWLNKVTDFAQAHNRIPIFWDDMVFKLAGLYETTYDGRISADEVASRWEKNGAQLDKSLSLFPRGCVYMRWNYDDPLVAGNQKAIDWYKKNNLTAMAATAAQLYSAMFPHTKSQFKPIKDFCKLTAEKKLDGILCTVWDDTSPHLEVLTRGIFDFALFSWNYEDLSIENAHAIYRQRFFSTQLASPSFNFQDIMEDTTTPFWETAFLEKGDREVYHATFSLMELPDPKKKAQWSKRYQGKLDAAKTMISQHAEIQKQLASAAQTTRRNQYTIELFNEINKLQQYSADLLLLLKQYDEAKSKNTAIAIEAIHTKVDAFPSLRKSFEASYGKTKMMGNPPGYLLDSNFHHHLANGTSTTDWIFIYEIAMNKKVNEWLASLPSK